MSAARAVFATTGVSSHEVFSHGLFMHYGYQLRLVPTNASNGEAAVPYSRNNLLAWSVRDRVWEHWWKRTQAPWTPVSDASFLLAHWAEYYWQPTSGPMTLRIEARQQEVKLTQVDTHLFTRNQAEVWQPIGAMSSGQEHLLPLPGTRPHTTISSIYTSSLADPSTDRLRERKLNAQPWKAYEISVVSTDCCPVFPSPGLPNGHP